MKCDKIMKKKFAKKFFFRKEIEKASKSEIDSYFGKISFGSVIYQCLIR